MIKKLLALLLVLSTLMLSGCVTSLDGEPDGTRPASLEGTKLLPDFPPRSAVSAEFNFMVSQVENAQDIDAQRTAYQNLQRAAFIYIMGPYSVASFISSDGGSIVMYQEDMMNLLSDYLSNYEQSAWSAIGASEWGAQLQAEFAGGAVTADKVRNAYPVSTADGQEVTQAVYSTREALYSALDEGADGDTLAELLNDALAVREDIASQMDYDGYLSYCFLKRDSVPYTKDDVLTLARLVRDQLCPVLAFLEPNESLPALSAEAWTQVLPELISRFPDHSEDLLYCLTNDLMTVLEHAEGQGPCFFSFPLYQYDASIGRARIANEYGDSLLVTGLLGSMLRDMAVPEDQWALSPAQLSGEVQVSAFQNLCALELDAVYGEESEAATQEYRRLLLEELCRSAMEYELLYRIYEQENVTDAFVTELAQELSQAYGLPLSAEDVYQLDQLLLGTVDCAQSLLGGLAGAQIGLLAQTDRDQAEALFEVMLSVYNYGSPVNQAVQAGMANPYSSDSIAALAASFA